MSAPGLKAVCRALLLSSLAFSSLAFATGAFAQSTTAAVSDAQVEANVLRALASAPELSTQNIQSSTVYGTVTLSGNVHDEAMRTKAENLVARALGVQKVVDELALGDTPAPADQANAEPTPGQQPAQNDAQNQPQNQDQLQSDGTYAPGPPPPVQQEGNLAPVPQNQGAQGQDAQGQDAQNQDAAQANPPANGQYPGGYGPPQDQAGQPGQPGQPGQYPNQAQSYPNQGQPYPNQAGQPYPNQGQQAYGPPPRRPMYQNNYPPQNGPQYGAQNGPQNAPPNYAPPGGQQAGLEVTVPAGALLRIRINRGLDSNHIQPGAQFDGTVLSDVAADGAIAIPRGASVEGTVVDAKKSGALKGRGELSLQINSVTLAGTVYPISSELWQRNSRDKTAGTVNNAVGMGALGAIIGAIAGGGAGAAIGAGVGGAAGVAGSAASPGGRVIVPPEAVLNFRMAQPAVVRTVSEQEMSRLAYAAGNAQPRPAMHRVYNPNYDPNYAPYDGR
ncbi:MAG TPA: BON domain-containing protein [Acidobacteriaceae bacterium]